jgi:hypothetical protein
LGCDVHSSLWSLVLHWLDISSVLAGEFRHHFLQFIHMTGLLTSSSKGNLVCFCLGDLEGKE